MLSVDRYLSNETFDHIDHALGRPIDPLGDTYRNRYVIDVRNPEVSDFRSSPFWKEDGRIGDMIYFRVTDHGALALFAHLKQIGDPHRLFVVSYDDPHQEFGGEIVLEVVGASHGKARYTAYHRHGFSDHMNFGFFCKHTKVRLRSY